MHPIVIIMFDLVISASSFLAINTVTKGGPPTPAAPLTRPENPPPKIIVKRLISPLGFQPLASNATIRITITEITILIISGSKETTK